MNKRCTKEQLRAFIKENNPGTTDDAHAIKEFFNNTIQKMLEAKIENV